MTSNRLLDYMSGLFINTPLSVGCHPRGSHPGTVSTVWLFGGKNC